MNKLANMKARKAELKRVFRLTGDVRTTFMASVPRMNQASTLASTQLHMQPDGVCVHVRRVTGADTSQDTPPAKKRKG